MCTNAWIHAYKNPDIAVLFNPIHAGFHSPLLWEAKGKVRIDDGIKVGCRQLTTIKKIPLPKWNETQKKAFIIYCTMDFNNNPIYLDWAKDWLNGKDRSYETAWSVYKRISNPYRFNPINIPWLYDVKSYWLFLLDQIIFRMQQSFRDLDFDK